MACHRRLPQHRRNVVSDKALNRPRIDKRDPDPRTALAAVVAGGRNSYAALSRMLGRGDGYLSRFVLHGVPAALRPDEHRRLADYFGLDERALGVRDLWAHS